MGDLEIDQVWECPRCGFQIGMGSPATLHPPTCRWGHESVECEQKTVEAFGKGEDGDG